MKLFTNFECNIGVVCGALLVIMSACTAEAVLSDEDKSSNEIGEESSVEGGSVDESSSTKVSDESSNENEGSSVLSSEESAVEGEVGASSFESSDGDESSDIDVVSSSESLSSGIPEPELELQKIPGEFVVPDAEEFSGNIGDADVTASVDYGSKKHEVSKYLSGINSTTYAGNFSTDKMLIEHVRRMQPGVIRYPGGDMSNMFFFGELPDDLPDSVMLGCNPGESWHDFTASADMEPSWQLTPDAYYDFIEAIGAEGFITVNYPYARYGTSADPVAAAAHQAAEWVRYDNGRTKYWEVGNETYACWEPGFQVDDSHKGGQPQFLSGDLYAEHFKVFADSMRAAAKEVGAEIKIGVTFADSPNLWGGSINGDVTKNWNDLLAPNLKKSDGSNYADFVATHSYFNNDPSLGGSGQNLTPSQKVSTYHEILAIEEYLNGKMDEHGLPIIPIALTEWNTESPNQPSHANSLQALSAIITMHEHEFIGSSYFSLKDQWRSDENWQGYTSMDFGIFNKGDPDFGDEESSVSYPYPTFYHFYYFNKVNGDKIVESSVDSDDILIFATSYSSGGAGVVVINKSDNDHTVKIDLSSFSVGENYYWYTVDTGDEDAFSQKVFVNGESNNEYDKGGPHDTYNTLPAFKRSTDEIIVTADKLTATYIMVEGD